MEDILTPIFIIIGAIFLIIPSGRLKTREQRARLTRKTFWQLVLMYFIGAGLVLAGFLTSGAL